MKDYRHTKVYQVNDELVVADTIEKAIETYQTANNIGQYTADITSVRQVFSDSLTKNGDAVILDHSADISWLQMKIDELTRPVDGRMTEAESNLAEKIVDVLWGYLLKSDGTRDSLSRTVDESMPELWETARKEILKERFNVLLGPAIVQEPVLARRKDHSGPLRGWEVLSDATMQPEDYDYFFNLPDIGEGQKIDMACRHIREEVKDLSK